jgi:acetyltransferase-like isoleucine patch superfamily enzyme
MSDPVQLGMEGVRGPRAGMWRLIGRIVNSVNRRIAEHRMRDQIKAGVLQMGRFSGGAPVLRLFRGERTRVVIGSFCSIAQEVEFIPGGNHRMGRVTTIAPDQIGSAHDYEPGETKGDILVGHDVWLGYGAVILSGVHIGNGAVVGARAVVGSDVRPYSIVVGNPAREVRRRFSDSQVEALQRIRWWEWPLETIQARLPMLISDRVDEFIESFEGRGSAGASSGADAGVGADAAATAPHAESN